MESITIAPVLFANFDPQTWWREVMHRDFESVDLDETRENLGIDEFESSEFAQTRLRLATDRQRAFVYVRAKGRCEYCEAVLDPRDGSWAADHLESAYNGGKTIVDNLACSCKSCNYAKGSSNADVFIDELRAKGLEWRDQAANNQRAYWKMYNDLKYGR